MGDKFTINNNANAASSDSTLGHNTNLYSGTDHILSIPKTTITDTQNIGVTPTDLNNQISGDPGNDQNGALQKLFTEWTTTQSGVNFKPAQQNFSDFSPPLYLQSPYSMPVAADTNIKQPLPAAADTPIIQPLPAVADTSIIQPLPAARINQSDSSQKQVVSSDLSNAQQSVGLPVLSPDVINSAAEAIRAASGVDSVFAWGSVDTQKLEDILQSYSLADRKRIEQAYNSKYEGITPADVSDKQIAARWYSLRDMLTARETWQDVLGHAHSETAVEVIGVLDKKDGGATFTSQITNALAKLQSSPNDTGAEEDLRHALSIMNSQQIQQLTADYQHWQGPKAPNQTNDLQHDLLSNSSISEATRQALTIYLKGTDKRTDDDTVAIANRALSNKDAHLFEEALAGSSQTARNQLINSHAEDTIKKDFYWVDQSLALDYLHTGKASTVTEVTADTHWLNKNKKGIEQAIDDASAQERIDFARGDELVKQGISPNTDDDKRAVKYYSDLITAFHGAAYDWEVDGWVSRMTSGSSNSLIEQISKTHQDGALGSAIGSNTDTAKLLSDIQNMSADEWNKLKGVKSGDGTADPKAAAEYQAEIRNTINDVWMGDPEKQQILTLLQWKIDAPTFDVSNKTPDSQSNSMLSLKNVFDQYQGYGLFNSGRDTTKMLDALVNISPADQQEARQNPDFMKFLHSYVDRLDSGSQKMLGERILDQTSNGTYGQSFDATAQFLQAATKDGTASTMINLVENDKELQGLVHSDQNYKSLLFDAIDKKLGQPSLLATVATLVGGAAAIELSHRIVAQNLVDALANTGHAPLDVKLALTINDTEKFSAITHMTPVEVNNFNSNSDAVLSHFNPDQQELVRNIVAYNSSAQTEGATIGASGAVSTAMRVTPVDTLRALVLGCADAASVATTLDSMKLTDADRQQLKADYNSKYHSDLVADVSGKTDGQDRDHLEHLLATVQISAQQDFLREDHQLNDSWSALDDWMKEGWDGSKEQARARIFEYQSALQDLSKNLQQLTPAQQQQFNAKCEEAIQLYRDSKTQLAEAAVNAAIIGISLVPGLNVVEAGMVAVGATVARFAAVGAVAKILGKAVIEGSDYKSDPYSLVKDGVTGALEGGFMKAAPGLVSKTATKIVGVTGGLAESALATTVGHEISQSVSLLAKAPVIQQAGNAITQSASFLSNAPVVQEAAKVATGYTHAAEAGYTAGFVSGGVNRTLEWNGKQDVMQNAGDIWNTALKSGADGMKAAMLFHTSISLIQSGVPIARNFNSGNSGSDVSGVPSSPDGGNGGGGEPYGTQNYRNVAVRNLRGFLGVDATDISAPATTNMTNASESGKVVEKTLASLSTDDWAAWQRPENIKVRVDNGLIAVDVTGSDEPFAIKGAVQDGKILFDVNGRQQLERDLQTGNWMMRFNSPYLTDTSIENLAANETYQPLMQLVDQSLASDVSTPVAVRTDSATPSDTAQPQNVRFKIPVLDQSLVSDVSTSVQVRTTNGAPADQPSKTIVETTKSLLGTVSNAARLTVDNLQNIPRFGSLGQAEVYLAPDATRAVILPKSSSLVFVNTLDPVTGQVQEIRVSNGPQDVQTLTVDGSGASAPAKNNPQPSEPLVLRRKANVDGWNIITHDAYGTEVPIPLTNHYANAIEMRNAALEYMQEPGAIKTLSNAARAALGAAGDGVRTRIARTFGRSVYANDPAETVNPDQALPVVLSGAEVVTTPEPSGAVGDGTPLEVTASNGEIYILHFSDGALNTIQSGELLFSIDYDAGVMVNEGKLGTSRAAMPAEIETLRNALEAYKPQSSAINMSDWQSAISRWEGQIDSSEPVDRSQNAVGVAASKQSLANSGGEKSLSFEEAMANHPHDEAQIVRQINSWALTNSARSAANVDEVNARVQADIARQRQDSGDLVQVLPNGQIELTMDGNTSIMHRLPDTQYIPDPELIRPRTQLAAGQANAGILDSTVSVSSPTTLPSEMADGWSMQKTGQNKTVIKDSVNNVSYYFDPTNRLNFVGLSDGGVTIDFGLDGGTIEVLNGTLMPPNLDQLNALEKTLNTYGAAYPDSDLSVWYSAIKQIRKANEPSVSI